MTTKIVFSSISGGYFVSQTSILTAIKTAFPDGQDFNIYFGNSGGAISNLLSLQYNGTKESVERALYSVTSSMFISPWVSTNIPFSSVASRMFSMFKSSFYNDGNGSKDVLNSFFTQRQLANAELWMGKFSIETNKNALLCTANTSNSVLRPYINDDYVKEFSSIETIKYAAGNIDNIAETLNATSSIPGYRPGVKIKDTEYMDGGLGSASSGSLLSNSIWRYSQANAFNKYQFFYVIGPDFKDEKESRKTHWVQELGTALKQFTRTSIYRERQTLFDLWMRIIGQNDISSLTYTKISSRADLATFFTNNNNKHYFITCYTKNRKVNIINFTREDLKEVFDDCYDNVYFEVYYS